MTGKKLKIGICDDEPEDLTRIKDELYRCLKILQEDEIGVHLFRDAKALYKESHSRGFDLVLLDLEMPGWNGFELAGQLCMEHRETKIVFVSNHENMVFDAYEYMPIWFVRKSRMERDMLRALQKYFQVTARKKLSFKMKDSFGNREVLLSEILYIECAAHTLTIMMADKAAYQIYGSLKPMEEELSKYGFLRIHKSYLVNQRYIREVGSRTVLLRDGTELDMGMNKKKWILEAMSQYERSLH